MPGWLNFLVDSFAFGATFMYGSTGEIITEKAGHLNLGVPGIMCMGAAGGCITLSLVGASSLPPFIIVLMGIIGSFTAAMLMGLIYSFLTVTLRANQNVTGLALTTFGVGLMRVLMKMPFINKRSYLIIPKEFFRYPFAGRNDSLQMLGVMFWLALAVAIFGHYVLYHTKIGLNLRSVGENPGTADAAGINVTGYKYFATCIGSGISGLGGLYYVLDYMTSEEAYLEVDAYGWLSIALVVFVLWKPLMTIPGSFIFGVLFTCSSFIASIPGVTVTMAAKPLLKMLPYIVTILVLVVSSMRNKRENQPPASLGLSYFREER